MVKWHEADLLNRMYCPLKDGKKIAMPRYYKDKIYTEADREAINEHLFAHFMQEIREMNDTDYKKMINIEIRKATSKKHKRVQTTL